METFGKGSKVKRGKLAVVDLNGAWRDMGRQYGALLANELRAVYEKAFEKRLFESENRETLTEQAGKFFANYPFKFKELLYGASETSELSVEDLKLVNALEAIAAPSPTAPRASSGVAVWGDYAEGPLVYGRNYDFLPWFRELDDDMVLTAFHPGDGSLSVATLGYAGGMHVVNGMNERGIFLELNDGSPSGGALWYDSRVPAVAALFNFLLDCSTLDEIESCFQTTKANFAYIVGVADGQTARCFEWPVFEVRRRESHSRPGLTVLTNHFTEFSWGLPRPDDKTYRLTRTRRQNLLNLAKHFKGAINEKVMMNIMDSKIEELGATADNTLYQLVVVPERYELWVKITGSQEWTQIEMKPLLRPRER